LQRRHVETVEKVLLKLLICTVISVKIMFFPCTELSYFSAKKWEGGEWILTERIVQGIQALNWEGSGFIRHGR
jgi:hypothetical protein